MPKRRDTLCAKNILLLFLLFEIRQSINFAPPSLFILFINNVLKANVELKMQTQFDFRY